VELTERAEAYSGLGYPFEICGPSKQVLRFTNDKIWPYIFLLALSYTHPNEKADGTNTGANIFEGIAWLGLGRFFGDPMSTFVGHSCHHLGKPSLSGLPNYFYDKIDELAKEYKEGVGYKPALTGHHQSSGDGKMDIIVRRGFPDKRGAQFFFFAGCASGKNWDSTKSYECNPDEWLETHFKGKFRGIKGMGRGYFIPRQIGADSWNTISGRAGTILDRCRLSLVTCSATHGQLTAARKWTERYCRKVFT